ncbi:hypothetical protein SB861_46145 [Paraburkholderia sp. SIMBA_049]
MDANFIDYDTLTLTMEKRIALHVVMAGKKKASGERREELFFAAAANESLFVWMHLAARMGSDCYEADKARLIEMVKHVWPTNASTP